MRVGLALGKSLAEVRALDPAEIRVWHVVDAAGPLGPRRDDYHAAMIASTLANSFRSRESSPARLADFMLFDREPLLSAEELRLKVRGVLGIPLDA